MEQRVETENNRELDEEQCVAHSELPCPALLTQTEMFCLLTFLSASTVECSALGRRNAMVATKIYNRRNVKIKQASLTQHCNRCIMLREMVRTSRILLGRDGSSLCKCCQWEISSWKMSQATLATTLFPNWKTKWHSLSCYSPDKRKKMNITCFHYFFH